MNTYPQDVRDAYYSVEYEKTIEEVTKNHRLHIDQADTLSDETFNLMLGKTHPSEFVGNINRRLYVGDDQAREIARERNEKTFRPIRASLMKIHSMIDDKKEQKERRSGRR